jgi:hypothetical protein
MEVVTTRAITLARGETLLAAFLAASAAVLVATLAPPGGDTAAHLYRTMLVREGVHLWDNLWFAGHYPLASYSLLYYVPTAVVGNVPLVVAAVIISAALFASIAVDEWGEAARWPARLFGLLAAGPLFTGTYSYALGLAAALATLRLLQIGRTWLAVLCAALALGFSPLAFAFLCIVLAALVLARGRRFTSRTLALAIGVAALAGVQLAAIVLFPSEGRYPYSPLSLAAVVAVSALGAALAARARRAAPIALFFVLWGLVNLAAFAIPSPFGDNLTRLRAVVFPVMLLAALLAGFRPRLLAGAALALALVYNLGPDLSALPKRLGDTRAAEQSFWAPPLSFLSANATANFRVEVVPTFGHWEAYFVPRAGFGLARGWYRQIDLAENPELYRKALGAATYRAWLRRMGVRFVLLPSTRLGPMGARREADLLRSGRSGLRRVFRRRDWSIFELPGASPILTGITGAGITRFDHERITGWTAAPGGYHLRVRYTPHWRVTRGQVCLARADDGMTRLVARRAGIFSLETTFERQKESC